MNRARDAGVEFEYRNGAETGHLAILESLGGGVGLLDYDLDGQIDFFLPGGGSFAEDVRPLGRAGALYRQIEPWRFEPVTPSAGMGSTARYTHGVAVADADQDGFPDCVITGYGGLLYYRNNGDGTFTEMAEEAELIDRLWSSSAAWGDLDQDAIPDLYVAHYVNWSPNNHPSCPSIRGDRADVCPPRQFDPLADIVYFSMGDGSFRNGSASAGLSPVGKGLGVLIADVDLDGLQDIYVANDTVPNFLYRNAGGGRFDDVSASSGTAVNDRGLPDGSMGVDLGDFDLDGLPDLWVSNYERESFALYRNFNQGIFRHVSQSTGVTAVGSRFVGWGTVFFDFDGDGDEDVFVSNGHVVHFPDSAPVLQEPLLFENFQGRRWQNIAASCGAWMSSPHPGRGCVAGDLDLDGDLDLVVSQVNEPAAILENLAEDLHWLELRLIGTQSNRDGLGAIVTIQTDSGRQQRQIKGGGSYASSSDLILHFGLGTDESISGAEIAWPSGIRQQMTDLPINRRHVVREPNQRQGDLR